MGQLYRYLYKLHEEERSGFAMYDFVSGKAGRQAHTQTQNKLPHIIS